MDEILYKCLHEGYKLCKRWAGPCGVIQLIQATGGTYEVWEHLQGFTHWKYSEERGQEYVNSYLRDHKEPYRK